MPGSLRGQIQTVLGAVASDAIGIALPHEHLLIDFTVMFAEPATAADKARAREAVSLANLGWIRQNFNANLDNLRLQDEQVAADEILLFKEALARIDARHRAQRGNGRGLLRSRLPSRGHGPPHGRRSRARDDRRYHRGHG